MAGFVQAVVVGVEAVYRRIILMHIGFRYHIATLVAVFFSLFLGIVVGSILFQDDLLVQEQNSIINELEQRFKDLELRTKEMQTNLKQVEIKEQLFAEGWGLIRSTLIGDQLQGREIVLLYDQADEPALERLTRLLEEAGAHVCGSYAWPNHLDEVRSLFEQIMSAEPEQPAAVIWTNAPLTETARQGIEWIHQLGWQISVLQPYNSKVHLAGIAEKALVIEMGDTFLGELAVVRGLKAGLTGVYGHSSEAVGLIPMVEMELAE
jgi:uncharacterized membrane protein YciS (DUF1049 family)